MSDAPKLTCIDCGCVLDAPGDPGTGLCENCYSARSEDAREEAEAREVTP